MKLRAAWGLPGEGTGTLPNRFFDVARKRASSRSVDDRTWADLELPRIFALLNTTVTPIGGQCLYRQLRTYEEDASALARRFRECRELRQDAALREELQLILAALEANSTAYMVDALITRPPAKLKHPRLIAAWGGLSFAVLVAAIALPSVLGLWWLWAGMLAINALAIFVASPKLDTDISALLDCRPLLRVAEKLSAHRFTGRLSAAAQLAEIRPQRRQLSAQTRWLAALAPQQLMVDSIEHAFLFAINVCFLVKWIAYARCVEGFTRNRHEWLRIFELIGTLDAAIAAANFLHRFPIHCAPVLTTSHEISLQDAYHPLMSAPVPNSVVLEGRSALISGSNMTGKTAFMKVVGLNIVFAQTLGFCLATSATIRRSAVMAAIRGEQGIEDGKSRYLDEIQSILGFVRLAERGDCRVFIIDEIFSGTNTAERIAAGKAVLDDLSRHAQVLATTHDVELQELLSERFERLHFREDPDVDGFFDYKLRVGASKERNAIRLLERVGFPPRIIEEAMQLAERSSDHQGD